MDKESLPEWYQFLKERHGQYMDALEQLGKSAREEGPLDERTAHLIQLAAAVTLRSEGAVHSHVRRAIEAGATPEEISHAIILLTSTVGFPNVSAALSWVEDVLESEEEDWD